MYPSCTICLFCLLVFVCVNVSCNDRACQGTLSTVPSRTHSASPSWCRTSTLLRTRSARPHLVCKGGLAGTLSCRTFTRRPSRVARSLAWAGLRVLSGAHLGIDRIKTSTSAGSVCGSWSACSEIRVTCCSGFSFSHASHPR